MAKITPFLWFDNNAEEAVNFYTSVFKNSKIGTVHRYGDAGPGPKGTVMTASFTIDGLEFTALNGGPAFKFNESISFVVHCKDQAEVDHYWEKLTSNGGKEVECGWLRINLVFPGRSCPTHCSSYWETKTRSNRKKSCKRCCR